MAADAIDQLDPRELGQNLKLAREQRGFRQEDAAKVIDVARTTLTAIEQGKRRIKNDELIKLVKAYGRSMSDFVRARPVARDFRVQFRGPSLAQMEDRSLAVSQNEFQELCRDYLELESIMNAPLNHNYPKQYVLGISVQLVLFYACRTGTCSCNSTSRMPFNEVVSGKAI